MSNGRVDRDERTQVVENAAFRWGYLVLSFGVLVDVALRGLVTRAGAWDLMALVVLGGLVTTAYQARFGILGRSYAWRVSLALVLGAAIAVALLSLLMRR
jgi:hypothetical protein